MSGPVIFALMAILLVLGLGRRSLRICRIRRHIQRNAIAVRLAPDGSRLRPAERRRHATAAPPATCTALLKDIEKQQAEQKQRPTFVAGWSRRA